MKDSQLQQIIKEEYAKDYPRHKYHKSALRLYEAVIRRSMKRARTFENVDVEITERP